MDPLRHRAEAMPGHQGQQLERRALRMLFAAFPLAHKARGDVQVAGEHSLACAFTFPQAPDFFGRQGAHRRQAPNLRMVCLSMTPAARSPSAVSWIETITGLRYCLVIHASLSRALPPFRQPECRAEQTVEP